MGDRDDGFDHADLDPSDEFTIADVIKALGTFSSDSWSDHPRGIAGHCARALGIIERRLQALEQARVPTTNRYRPRALEANTKKK